SKWSIKADSITRIENRCLLRLRLRRIIDRGTGPPGFAMLFGKGRADGVVEVEPAIGEIGGRIFSIAIPVFRAGQFQDVENLASAERWIRLVQQHGRAGHYRGCITGAAAAQVDMPSPNDGGGYDPIAWRKQIQISRPRGKFADHIVAIDRS